jgi:hypothetical protein
MLIGWNMTNWEPAQTDIYQAVEMQGNKSIQDIIENRHNSFALLSWEAGVKNTENTKKEKTI